MVSGGYVQRHRRLVEAVVVRSGSSRLLLIQSNATGNWRVPSRWSLRVQPGVLQALRRRGPLVWLQLQHGQQEVAELSRLVQRPLVLLQKHLEQAPRLQVGDVTQLT